MGLKYTVETIGELKLFLNSVPNDTPFQFLFDGTDYRKLSVQVLYDRGPEQFVKMEPVEE